MRQAITLFFSLFLCFSVYGQTNDKDIKLRSNFIIDLIDKVEWPDGTVQDSFVINVVGDNGIVSALQSLVASNSSGRKKIVINSVSIDVKFEACQMVVIATDSLNHLAKILKKTAKKPILTVSMYKTFARYGVMINIREITDSKIKYAINKMTARKAKLEISKDLVKNAVETYG